MPIYRKGRYSGPSRLKVPRDRATLSRVRGRRVIKRPYYWASEHSSIDSVELQFGFSLRKKIAEYPQAVVVDWGCGAGISIAELAKLHPKARCFGFSREYYKEWREGMESGATFIHARAVTFPRYFKRNSVDILYSSLGLTHLDHLPKYIVETLVPRLKVGGLIVFDRGGGPAAERKLAEELAKAGNLRLTFHPQAITIEKVAE